MSWRWAIFLAGLCEAAQLLSALGDISLSEDEVSLYPLNDLFFGSDLEFSLSFNTSQAAFLRSDSSCKEVLRISQGSERWSLGPLFHRSKETLIVLFTAHKIEVWTHSSSSLTMHSSLETSATVLGVDKFNEDCIAFWAAVPGGLEVYLTNVVAANLTASRLHFTFPCESGDKVEACSMNNALLISRPHSTSLSDYAYYSVDPLTMEVTKLPLELSFLEDGEIVDVSCTPFIVVLTGEGYYKVENGIMFIAISNVLGKLLSFESLLYFNSRAVKAERGVWVGDGLLFITNETASYRFLRTEERLMVHEVVAHKQHFIQSFNLGLSSYAWKVHLPVSGESAAVEILREEDRFFSLLLVDDSAMRLLFVTFGPVFLGLRGLPTPYEVEVCARKDAESACTRSIVSTVSDEGVLYRNGALLAASPAISLGEELFVTSNVTEADVDVSEWVSGANLDVSLQFSFTPSEMSMEHSLVRRYYTKAISGSFSLPLAFQQCVQFRVAASEVQLYSVSGSKVLFVRVENHVSIKRHETSIKGANLTASALTQSGVLMLRAEDGQFYKLKANDAEEVKSPVMGEFRRMLANECDVVVVSAQSIDVYDPEAHRWQTILDHLSSNVHVWTDFSLLLVLQDGHLQCFQKLGESYHLINTISLSSKALCVTYSHPCLLVYHSDHLIEEYHANSLFDVVLTKRVKLQRECAFRGFQAKHSLLVVDCGNFVQVISLAAAQRDARVFRLATTRPFFLTTNEAFQLLDLVCTSEACNLLSYQLNEAPRVVLKLAVEVVAPNFNSTLVSSGELAVTSEGQSSTSTFDIAVSNAGGLIRLERGEVAFDVSWSDSLAFSPYSLLAGSSVAFSVNSTAATLHPQLTERPGCALPCSSTASNLSLDHLFMLCRYSSAVEIYLYHVESFPCTPAAVRRLTPRDLKCDIFEQLEFVLQRGKLLVFYLTGMKITPLQERKSLFQFFSYDISSMEVQTLTTIMGFFSIDSAHLVWEQLDLAHVFFTDSILLHFSLSWVADQVIVRRETIPWPTFSSPQSMSSVLRADAWHLFVLDSDLMLREYSVLSEMQLLRTVPCTEALQNAVVAFYGERALVLRSCTLDVLKIVDFSLEKRIYLPQSRIYFAIFQKYGAQPELAIFLSASKIAYIVNITAPRSSEIQSFRFSSRIHFIGASSILSCMMMNCSLLTISEPTISIEANGSRSDTVDIEVWVKGENNASWAEVRVRVHRFKKVLWGVWLSVGGVLLLLSLVLVLKSRAAKNRRPVMIELEERPINNFSF